MSKRKRSADLDGDDYDASDSGPPAPKKSTKSSMRTMRILAKLERGEKILQKALKLAAGFERQKFGRRKKTASEKNDAGVQSRLDAEHAALKTLDFATVARNHLYKSLLRIKAVANSPARPESLVMPPKATTADPAVLNVTARLYKASAVRKAMSEVTRDTLRAFGVVTGDANGAPRSSKGAKVVAQPPGDVELDELHSGDAAVPTHEEDFSGSGSEVSFDSDAETAKLSQRKGRIFFNGGPDEGLQSEESDIGSDVLQKKARNDRTAETRISARPKASTFVPTMSAVGYWSGSESEPESDIDVAPKKNRRGQRARQQIAEKKYGSKAKHLMKKPRDDRNQGWDSKKGAQLDGGERWGARGRGPQQSGANTEKIQPRAGSTIVQAKKENDGPVHPSWEAAKRAKEQAKSAAFAGKKITFD